MANETTPIAKSITMNSNWWGAILAPWGAVLMGQMTWQVATGMSVVAGINILLRLRTNKPISIGSTIVNPTAQQGPGATV